ncbi:MAG TPA: PRC-barrel domain-containing protein [Geminicoccaceae bacterium]|nr:PRC-barrel domain-containing protein [Geminicoccaceae bacterium]
MQRTLLAASALTVLLMAPAIAQQATQPAQTQPVVPPQGQDQQAQGQQQPATQGQQQTVQQPAPAGQQPVTVQQQPAPAGQQQVVQEPAGQQPMAQRQIAEQCMSDLQALTQQMNEEGYWLTGWRDGMGGGYGLAGPGTAGVATDPALAPGAAPGVAPGTVDPAATPPAATTAAGGTAPAQPGATVGAAGGPWGDTAWGMGPHHEIRTLYAAAHVLATRGDEEGCQTVLAETQPVYGEYVTHLREAGVEPGQVVGWREQEILAARPVTELGSAVRFDQITGTELRNVQDGYLGSVEDVILDPQTGQIAYAIVARGGFLGIGRDHIAVPWQQLQVTPGMNTFVLNVPEQVVENAPTVDPDAFAHPAMFDQQRQAVDQYWQQHQAG